MKSKYVGLLLFTLRALVYSGLFSAILNGFATNNWSEATLGILAIVSFVALEFFQEVVK